MRINLSVGTCFLAAAWGTLLCTQPLGAQQPEAKVTESVNSWLEKMDNAADAKAIREAREGMTKAYAYYEGKGQGYVYAQEATKGSIPRLARYDPVRQINLAMVLSKMPQASIQPALDAMVAHPKPRAIEWPISRHSRSVISVSGSPPPM